MRKIAARHYRDLAADRPGRRISDVRQHESGTLSAWHASLIEEGDGAPSLRPLWMLLPYLWPKGHPELKARVVASLVCLLLAILATTAFPLFMGWITNQLTRRPPATIAMFADRGADRRLCAWRVS